MSKSIALNSVFNLLHRGYNVLYPLITSAYISRLFLADGMGELMFAINIVTYFTMAASLGIPSYAIKVVANIRDSKRLTSIRFSEIASLIFLSSIAATILYYVTIIAVNISSFNAQSFQCGLILGLMVVSNIFNYDWLFEAEEDYKYLANRSILIKTVALIFLFSVVKSRSDILVYCFIYASISVANNLFNFLNYRRYANYTFKNLNIRQHLKPVFILFAAVFATDVYILLDSTMLGILCPPESLGYYSNSSRLVRSSFGLLSAATFVFTPRLNYLYGKGDIKAYKVIFQKYFDISLFLAIPSSVGILYLAPQIIQVVFGSAFLEGSITMRILSVLLVFFTLAMVFGHVGLIVYHKEKYILQATICGAVSNFLLNLALIPALQQNGAAIASVVSEILVTCVMVHFSLKSFKIPIFNSDLLKSVLASVIMLIPIIMGKQYINNTFVYLTYSIIIGLITYLICIFMLHHSFSILIKEKCSVLLNNINHKNSSLRK